MPVIEMWLPEKRRINDGKVDRKKSRVGVEMEDFINFLCLVNPSWIFKLIFNHLLVCADR